MTVVGFYGEIKKAWIWGPGVYASFSGRDPVFFEPDLRPGSFSVDHEPEGIQDHDGRDGGAVCCLLIIRLFVSQKQSKAYSGGIYHGRLFVGPYGLCSGTGHRPLSGLYFVLWPFSPCVPV